MHPRNFDKAIEIRFGKNGEMNLKTISFASEKQITPLNKEQEKQSHSPEHKYSSKIDCRFEIKMENEMQTNINDIENWTSDIHVAVGVPDQVSSQI